VRAGQEFLGAVSGTPVADSLFEEVRMEALAVPVWSRAAGRTLAQLSPARDHGVQIAGVRRGGIRILNPSAEERLHAGDGVLALGAPAHLADFKAWLRAREAEIEGLKAD
jgi:CPA2 family monovalent cation:H+ antiporter-2